MADGKVIIETDLDSSGIESGLNKMRSAVDTGMRFATKAIGVGTAALSAFSVASVKAGSEFEAEMSRVKAISGATEEEFKKLKEQAIDLGATTAFSATEAAKGMENLAAAGFTVEDTMAAMPGLLDMAAASGEDLASSSDIAASTLRGFGLEAEQAGHVADVLAENANRTNSSVAATGEAMKYVAPLARAAGLSFEETAAAVGLMANAGIQGSQAGTTLRGAISRMSKPTKIMKEAMDELGISFYDSEGKMLSLKDQIKMLKTAFKGMTDEQKNNYLVTLYGQESLSGMLALINEGEESLGNLTESFQNCDGAAKKAADTMMDNLKGSVEELSGSAETLGILFYEEVSGSLKDTTVSATESVNAITDALKSGGIEGAVQAAGNQFAKLAVGAAQQAPKLMNAGVSVVESFVQGISQNKGKLYSAGIDIASTLANGLARLLPKELSKPVQDAVKSITKSLQGGGLKTAGKTIITTCKNMISVVGKITGSVLPPFIKLIDKVGKNIKIVAPIVTTLVVGMKSYNTISKLVTVSTKNHAKAVRTLNKMEKANALQLVATNGGLTIRQTLMALFNGQITVATAATGLWTKAQTTLNMAMSANPIGLVVTAIGALAAGIIAYKVCVDEAQPRVDALTESERALVDSIDEETTAINERREAYEETAGNIQAETDHTKSLADELLRLADANGNVQEADEARVKFILNELNNALGTEYTLVDGVITQYSNLKDNIYDVIQAKTANALLEAKNEEYVKAIQNEEQAMQKAIAAQKDYDAQAENVKAAKAELEAASDALAKKQEECGARGAAAEAHAVHIAQQNWQKEKDLLDKKKAKYDEASTNYATYYNTIEEYENAATLVQQGSYEKAVNILKSKSKAFFDYGEDIDKATQESLDALYREAIEAGIAAEQTKANFDAGMEGFGEEAVKDSQKAHEDAIAAWENAYNEAHGIGGDMGEGLKQGLESKKSSLLTKAKNLISSIWKAMRKEADSHSPSKKTIALGGDIGDGLEIGMEDSIPANKKAASKLVDSAMKPMESSIKDVSALAQKMKMAVNLEKGRMGAELSSKIVYKMELGNEDALLQRMVNKFSDMMMKATMNEKREFVFHTHVDLDGKQVGYSTAKYVDQKFSDDADLRSRGNS